MSRLFKDLRLDLDEDLAEKLAYLMPDYGCYRLLKKSVDARKRHDIHEIVSVEVFGKGETPPNESYELSPVSWKGSRPIIIGTGPAGLFAAIRLVERGIKPIIFERGSTAEKRVMGINQYWRTGQLDKRNNVCFGEGGAGLYSDGKLITRIKSPHIPYVMHRLVKFGAPEEIQYLANPHVGSDRIRRVIPKIRAYLLENGCDIHYDTQVTKFIESSNGSNFATQRSRISGIQTEKGETFLSDHIILATGHSAQDIFDVLRERNVVMEGKSFAVGLRVEHPQKMINQIQYRGHADHPRLGSANYKLTHHDSKSGIGVYSFCMCPGGYILSSGTEPDGIVVNGMSNYHRNSPFANAAIVVSIDFEKRFGVKSDIFSGLDFRKDLEKRAYQAVIAGGGTKQIPAQNVLDFMEGRGGSVGPTSSPSGVLGTRLDQILPPDLVERLRSGLSEFNDKINGFIGPQGQLHGVESRTSCPVRITRDEETLQSVSHGGLYPAGEGAGYAGGITSAAVDGIRCAEAVIQSVQSQSIQSLAGQFEASNSPSQNAGE